ncbi:MAG: PKD domain-containing protein [Bacteroidota bacterium]
MKTIRLLFALILMFGAGSINAQTVTVLINGHVMDEQTNVPIVNHVVEVKIYADSSNTSGAYFATGLTNPSGFYSIPAVFQFTPGIVTPIYVGTTDCMMMYVGNVLYYTGSQTAFISDFSICNDSIIPPSPCENNIGITGIQSLTVGFKGSVANTQVATYTWDFGDNYSGTGEYVTHTYAQQGFYNVTLQTVTANGCFDESTFPLVLMDSINPPSDCQNIITVGSIQGLTATLQGNMLNGQAASYFWDLGDGHSASGQNVTHTYAQQGYYNVTLSTITPDSCMSTSVFMLMLSDSTNTGCSAVFIATPTSNPMSIAFQAITPNALPMQFTWEFGDGTTGSGQSTTHTYGNPGTYMVQLISSNSVCTSVFSAPVTVPIDSTGTLNINGYVVATNNIVYNAQVTLFGINAAGYFYPTQSTYTNPNGWYNFMNVIAGTYIILAIPASDSMNASQYLPTFYGDVVFWDQATEIVLGVPQNPYNINLQSFDSIGSGGGYIGGQLLGGGKAMMTGGQEVLLLDLSNTPVRVTYTDAQGNFSFASLPFGDYLVSPMVTGSTTVPTQVNLNASNPTASIVMTINGNTITGISKAEPTSQIGNIYPNPAVSEISVNVKSEGNVKMQILDATGKTIVLQNITVPANGKLLTIPVSGLTPGLYFMVIQDENGNTSSKRFVKN